MQQEITHLPGHLALAPGRAVALEPRECGVMQVGAGTVFAADKLLGPGDKLQLWRGDSVQVVNIAREAAALYSWEACAEQPSVRQRLRHASGSVARFFGGHRYAQLAACGETTWCVAS